MSNFSQLLAKRRSVYALKRELPLPPQEIVALIEHAQRHAPTAFNSQSTRLQVLFGAEHEKLWDMTADALRAVVPAEQFAATAEKLAAFRAAAGTILFFEDRDVIKGLQERMPVYADTFPGSADQGGAMLQYALWTLFSAAGIGANLQHYNPLIDDAVAARWHIPASWHLRAQLVFGGIAAAPGEKDITPLQGRLRVAGV